tara:strand:+ start:648 stop:1223 length:576 start_codon:yes stop_codon:yes gene_type:complete
MELIIFSVIVNLINIKIISIINFNNSISKASIERLDLLLLAIETIDLNASESIFAISNKLNLQHLFPSKVSIWKLRSYNPMRKSQNSNNINNEQFNGLIKITSEMSKYLYPYIRAIVCSKDDFKNKPELWNDFQSRYIQLIEERFNTESIVVKNLMNYEYSQEFYKKILFTLSLASSEEGYNRLKLVLINL